MATPPTVSLDGSTTITGTTEPTSAKRLKAVDVFYGIPYASAERFKDPLPLAPGTWPLTGRLNGSKPGPGCPSPLAAASAETPLTLNVFRPAQQGSREASGVNAGGPLLPVAVFFHGGAFNFGSPHDSSMGPYVSHAPRGIVVVTVAYRLGALGFLNEDRGAGGNSSSNRCNLGLKDQKAAVEWLIRWVGAFGGDGGDITMMGVSAGAHSIGHHMLNPQRLPVRKVILESGSPTARSIFTPTHTRTTANVIALKSQLGRKTLTQCTTSDIVNASVMVWAQHMNALTWPFQPVIDGEGGVVPDMPLKLWEGFSDGGDGNDQGISVLTGFCSHEGMDFIPKRPPPFRAFFSTLIPGLTEGDLDALEALYPESGSTTLARRLGEAYGDYAYKCPILHTAHAASKRGGGSRVYLYEFAAITSVMSRSAAHASHTQTLSREMGGEWSGLRATGEAMLTRWTDFICSAPGAEGGDMTSWPVFRSPFGHDGNDDDDSAAAAAAVDGAGELLVFGEGNTEAIGGGAEGTPVRTRTLTRRERDVCRFWWERMELSQGTGERGIVKKTW